MFQAAGAYDAFMGRYSGPLAPSFVDFARVGDARRVVDVGCGPGAMTAELVRRVGADAVAAVDPSEPFVEAARERHPGVDVRVASAEALPFADGAFDAALAQLVVHFMSDPVAGLREMARVTRPGGTVAACVWDHAEQGQGALSAFWETVHEFDPAARDESALAGSRRGHLGELFRDAGLDQVEEGEVWSTVEHASFDEWWEPYTRGVGPVGVYVDSLADDRRAELVGLLRGRLGDAPVVRARAWAARGTAG